MLVQDDAGLRDILENARTIAVVGLSSDPSRPSHGVADYLVRVGYRIIPVNPNETEVLGLRAVPSLAALAGEAIDIVDVFRRPNQVLPHVEEAIAIGAPVLWMQVGIINHQAAARASEAGLRVVMNRCTLREHARLLATTRSTPAL